MSHAAFCAAMLPGCFAPPDSSERFEDSIIVTGRDKDASFGSFETFFVRPDIRVLDESNDAAAPPVMPETLPADTAEALIEQTRRNLLSRGYRPAADKESADLAVELVFLRNVHSDYYCYYWSDSGYWGYSGYYYYYPYSCSSSAWRSGMLATNVIDLMRARSVPVAPNTSAVLRGVWFSGVYGVETDTASVLMQRALEGIDQAFVQSPYFTSLP
jgi:hypothetical protein